ncbi:MAG: hypothetical protein H0V43_08625 [Gemmatimonadales bacterium]|nr:hypothetical protein [Gemmatimonadales bacterium]
MTTAARLRALEQQVEALGLQVDAIREQLAVLASEAEHQGQVARTWPALIVRGP